MARHASAGTPATLALTRAHVRFTAHEYEHDPLDHHFGEETVEQLGTDPERTFKTLVAELTGGGDPLVCAVVPVSGHLDLKALAHAAGAKKAAMADPADAERVTGYVVGGISPIGQKRRMPVIVDASARSHATILVSGGRRGLSIELAPDDLVGLLKARYAEIGRD
ncbi:Cys-tRNA(Pro) deacylase [Brooklawnia cerclae]|uniref:Cys-tRNA(Pro)/Cys-tRNA(Cys) deacylase n=1 Tax=Brooklawnia cerclae TaxID=349934 RepID=A0ABX0SH30_9ACTN|nr:Cys-tRNA(Pro) deacylase [Brooklawnia cerclae]NIH56505.1 Cys-tRNA(Pro)/Cys-tRNA(Cys) deacylase [Brooklawnia cerclae]